MSFQLKGFKAYGIRASGSTRQHCRQVAQLKIAQANTDTAIDLSAAAGTFWTAAVADATYGALGSAALAAVQAIQSIAAQIKIVDVPVDYTQVLSGASGKQYTVTITSNAPVVTFVSGSAPTSHILTVEWTLQDGMEAVNADLGANF